MARKPPEERALRSGFTTGTCMTAGAVAAWTSLHGSAPESINLLFPDGQYRTLPVDRVDCSEESASGYIIKDAGDDIDCTNKAEISVCISPVHQGAATEADFVEQCGSATLILRGGEGVGRVTRRGLDVPVGQWSINPVPRRMLLDNLVLAGFGDEKGCWLAEVRIKNGVALAKKTLNPVLGVEGGLSILGTSGIVIPCSNKAYIATIQALLRGASELGETTAILVTGGRTHKTLRKQFPQVDETAFVRFGDFIKDALMLCDEYQFKRALVGCMPGKLAKYAQGHAYTHAHTIAQSMGELAELLREGGFSNELLDACKSCRSVRELLAERPAEQGRVIHFLKQRATVQLSAWAGNCAVELRVLDFNGEPYTNNE